MGTKEAYQEKIEAQIKEWSTKLKEYKARADQAGAEVKVQMYQRIDRMRTQKEAAQEKLNEIKAANTQGWDALKTGTEKVVGTLKQTWEEMKSKYH
jgi:predicted nuclease with TOPRIM domain